MSAIEGLVCRECGRAYPVSPQYVCEFCFGPLEAQYDYAKLRRTVSRRSIEEGPRSIWRYRALLPTGGGPTVDLGTGLTPLIRAENLGRKLGLENLYLKNDTVNPTYSFKDRVVSVALTKAREFGFTTVACASTGNLANSVAAHAAHSGFEAYVFIPADLERGKIISSAIYGPHLIGVQGGYDDVNRLCAEVAAEFRWAFVNINIRPFYAEGSKTLGFETVEQLGWRAPDNVVVPVASGSLLTKIAKGIHELFVLGLSDSEHTKLFGAQAQGCNPVVTAFKAGTDIIKPMKPDTIAKSLAIGNPADGYYALDAVRRSGGSLEDVSDEEVTAGVRLLAETEGIFAETAGGVTIGVLKKLAESGQLNPRETTVAYVTGIGLKTLEAVEDSADAMIPIEPTLSSFKTEAAKRGCLATPKARK